MRITGGRWRSRALKAPKGTATRPTSDRVREALFSTLASMRGGDTFAHTTPQVGEDAHARAGARVLDLYAGTGALAFEAMSRGASSAVLVEQAREAASIIRENATALGAEAAVRLVFDRVERALARLEPGFDVVFVDPPYVNVNTTAFPSILARAAELTLPGGILVLEHASTDAAPELSSMDIDRSRRYGDTTLTFYRAP